MPRRREAIDVRAGVVPEDGRLYQLLRDAEPRHRAKLLVRLAALGAIIDANGYLVAPLGLPDDDQAQRQPADGLDAEREKRRKRLLRNKKTEGDEGADP